MCDSNADSKSFYNDLGGKTVKELLCWARLAEQTERFEDMCCFMKHLVEKKCSSSGGDEESDLQIEERNLLSVAYKNVVGGKRQSWRTLNNPDTQESCNYSEHEPSSQTYKKIVEQELINKCNEVLSLLQDGPIKLLKEKKEKAGDSTGATTVKEDLVFYLKMSGDYYRYLAEVCSEEDIPANERFDYKNKAREFYDEALQNAKEALPETHPTRLGLALNFSVCHYEILKNKKEACKLAKEAFDSAIEKLDTLNDASYKDSTLIMQLLRDNLTLWTSDTQDDAEQT